MSEKHGVSTSVHSVETDHQYNKFETLIRSRVATAKLGEVFRTDAEGLFDVYLSHVPSKHRQHYNCRTCRKFFEKYADLVTITEDGTQQSLLWTIQDWAEIPPFFHDAVCDINFRVREARVVSVAFWDSSIWGCPKNKDEKRGVTWTHLSGVVGSFFFGTTMTAEQKEAESIENRGVLARAFAELKQDNVDLAMRYLQHDKGFIRPEKALTIGEWFTNLCKTVKRARGKVRENLIWRAVASAPVGFCNVKNTVFGTLVEDAEQGLPTDVIRERWNKKLAGDQYQRPQADPSEGSIAVAEKRFEQLGLAPSLRRRFATMADIPKQSYIWKPRELKAKDVAGGIFGHLRQQTAKRAETEIVNGGPITWVRFAERILPEASVIDVSLSVRRLPLGALVTAADYDAPPILQWDGLDEGVMRNPVSWYLYVQGSYAREWKMQNRIPVPVKGVVTKPCYWQDATKFTQHGLGVILLLEGCMDTRNNTSMLFPEILRSDLRDVRSVIEAHSKVTPLEGYEQADAAGFFIKQGEPINLEVRVLNDSGWIMYIIDRWE